MVSPPCWDADGAHHGAYCTSDLGGRAAAPEADPKGAATLNLSPMRRKRLRTNSVASRRDSGGSLRDVADAARWLRDKPHADAAARELFDVIEEGQPVEIPEQSPEQSNA